MKWPWQKNEIIATQANEIRELRRTNSRLAQDATNSGRAAVDAAVAQRQALQEIARLAEGLRLISVHAEFDRHNVEVVIPIKMTPQALQQYGRDRSFQMMVAHLVERAVYENQGTREIVSGVSYR